MMIDRALSFMAVAAIGSATAAQAQPRAAVWATYFPATAMSSLTPGASGASRVMHGHGEHPIVSVRLRSPIRGRVIEAEMLSPAGFDRHEVVRRDEESAPDEADDRARWEFDRLRDALHHLRPIAIFSVGRERGEEVEWTPALRRHADCSRRLLRRARAIGLATAEYDDERESWRSSYRSPDRLARPRIDVAATLLRLLSLDLPRVTNGRWAALERQFAEIDAQNDRRRTPSQFTWRSQQVRAAGQEFALEVDLLRDRSSPAALLCRTLRLPALRSAPTKNRCSIDGFIDTRDGWPIAISFSRTMEGGGERQSRGTTFYRLTPLAHFLPPPNPCAAG